MAENPYKGKILELTTALSDLRNSPVAPMFSEEEIRRRQEKQSFDEQMAVLAKLSGDKPLGQVGGALLPEALLRSRPRITEHGEYDPIPGKLSVFPEYTRRHGEDRLARDLQNTEIKSMNFEAMEPHRQAADDARRAALDLRKAVRDFKAEKDKNRPLIGKPLQTMEEQGAAIDTLEFISKKLKEEFEPKTSKGFRYLGDIQDKLTQEFPFATPEAWKKNQRAWAELQRLFEMPGRYKLFGATLTPNELASWTRVTPSRGWAKKQIDAWLEERTQIINQAAERNAEGLRLGGFNSDQLEHYTRGKWKAPTRTYVPGQGFVE